MIDTERLDLPSASSSDRYAACPGSFLLAKGLPPVQTAEMREWAESGNRIHLWLEDPNFIDLTPWPNELEVAVACKEQRDALVKKIFGVAIWGVTIIKEDRLWLKRGRSKEFSGKGDFIAKRAETGLIVDYKTGRGEIAESPKNRQLRSLMVLLAISEHGIKTGLKRVYVAIIQPLLSREPVMTCYELEHIERSIEELKALIIDINNPDAPRVAGDHCKYCPGMFKCPEAKHLLVEIAAMCGGEPIGLQLAELLNRCHAAKPLIKAMEGRAKEILKVDPTGIPGWTVGKPGSVRAINDPFGAYKALEEAKLVTRDQFLGECVSCPIGALQTTISTHNNLTPKQAEEKVNEVCGPFISTNPKEPSLEKLE